VAKAHASAGEQLYMCAAKRTPCTTARPAEPAGPIVTHPAPPPRPTRVSRRHLGIGNAESGPGVRPRPKWTGVTKWGVIVRGFLWVSTSGTHEAMMSVSPDGVRPRPSIAGESGGVLMGAGSPATARSSGHQTLPAPRPIVAALAHAPDRSHRRPGAVLHLT
jgi:hypothetical protein